MNEENEKKKRYLKSYLAAVGREKRILEEIQRLREDRMFPSMVNDGLPHASHCSDLSDYIVLIDGQIERLKEERLRKVRLYSDVESRIGELENDNEREALRLKYLRGLTWEEVAAELGYSWKQMHRIHAAALKNLKMTWNDTPHL